jgi:hypothetical protein
MSVHSIKLWSVFLLSQSQIVVPNPSLITWCTECGTTSVGKAEQQPAILQKLGRKCVKHQWAALAPFNGVHGNSKPKLPTVEMREVRDSPPCSECGSLTRRIGTCYYCDNCGTTSGCS